MNAEKLTKQVNELFRSHEYDDIKPLLLSYKDLTEHNNSLAMVCYLCTIHERERKVDSRRSFLRFPIWKNFCNAIPH